MSKDLGKCRITVLKRMFNQALVDAYLEVEDGYGACDRFEDGQEFVLDNPYFKPEGFCSWAWADIRHDIMLIATGGDPPWIKQPHTIISGCTDWFRPIIFKIERVS